MNTEILSALFENGAYTLVVQKGGVTVHKEFGRGVGPALRVFDAQPELLKGALVCDTIVGKAAAAIYILGGASCVYAETMSAAAAEFLTANGVDCACETKTEKLLNRQGTGLCPFEQAVLELERPEDCLPVVRATSGRMRMRSILQSQSSISIRRRNRTRPATQSRSRICIRRRKRR